MTDTQMPGLAEYAVQMIKDNKTYKTELVKGIRHIADYKPEQLAKNGIVKEGKVHAEGLMNYINAHVAKPLLKGRNFDANDAGYLAQFLAIKGLVERYGHDMNALLERVAAQYASASTRHVGQKDVGYAGTLPTAEGKVGNETIARIAGMEYAMANAIKSIKDPNDNSSVKGEMEDRLVQAVEEGIDAGQLEKILKAAKGSGAHAPH